MQHAEDTADHTRDWRLEQGPHLIELMDVITKAGQAMIAADGDRLWLVLDDLELLIGRWRSALRAAQSPVPVDEALSGAGGRQ